MEKEYYTYLEYKNISVIKKTISLKKQELSLRKLHSLFLKLNDDFPQRTKGKGRCGADGFTVPLWRKTFLHLAKIY